VKGRLLDVMRRSGSYEHLGADHFFLSADDAVRHAEAVLGTGPELDIADRGEVLIEETRELHLPPPTPTRWQAK
jgi:hypothetical protein